MTLCCMCQAPVTTKGWSVCDVCHGKGRLALVDHRLREKAEKVQQYERQ